MIIEKPIFMKRFRRDRRRRRTRRRPINVLASAFTTLNLYCGVASIFASTAEQFDKAAFWILAAIIFDMLDGTVARLTHSTSEFGKELDSLCDVVSFGVAPAVLIYTAFLPAHTTLGMAANRINAIPAVFFVICGALRLARYNVYQSTQQESFTGLPTPAAGGTIASFVLFARDMKGIPHPDWILASLALILSYLMVSTVHYPKNRLKMFVLSPRSAFRVLGYCAILIAVMHYATSPEVALFPLTMAYMIFGITDECYGAIRRRGKPPETAETSPETETFPHELPDESPVSKTGERL